MDLFDKKISPTVVLEKASSWQSQGTGQESQAPQTQYLSLKPYLEHHLEYHMESQQEKNLLPQTVKTKIVKKEQ